MKSEQFYDRDKKYCILSAQIVYKKRNNRKSHRHIIRFTTIKCKLSIINNFKKVNYKLS